MPSPEHAPHKVWRVRIGSGADGPVVCVQDLPERATYYIESKHKNGWPTIEKRAKDMASEDGIPWPIVLSGEWVNSPYLQDDET